MKLKKLKKGLKKLQENNTVAKINTYLQKEATKSLPYTPKVGHRPSKLAHPCHRLIYYSYFKLPEDTPAGHQLVKYQYAGNAYEDVVISWLKGIDQHIPYRNKGNGEVPKDRFNPEKNNPQFPVKSDKWRIRKGYIDNVAYVNGKLWLFEIKTAGKNSWEKLTKPKPEHLVQGQAYVQLFNDLFLAGEYDHIPEIQDKCVGIKFLYLNRDNADLLEFSYTIEDLTQGILALDKKIQVANQYVDSKTLPPKTTGNCYFCPYRISCDKDANQPAEIPKEILD